MARRKLVVGNWKMHGLSGDLGEVEAIAAAAPRYPGVDTGLCLPATLIERAVAPVPGFAIGAQDVHEAEKGAHTGCVSAKCSLDAGASMAIVGHSERREAQRESDEEVRAKAQAGLRAGLPDHPVRRRIAQGARSRRSGPETVDRQLDASLPRDVEVAKLAIAYEPIWAIGTGRIPTIDDIAQMHSALRSRLRIRLWRGGGGDPDPLRRLGEGFECRRNLLGRRRRRRFGRWRQPQGGGFHPHRRSRGVESLSALAKSGPQSRKPVDVHIPPDRSGARRRIPCRIDPHAALRRRRPWRRRKLVGLHDRARSGRLPDPDHGVLAAIFIAQRDRPCRQSPGSAASRGNRHDASPTRWPPTGVPVADQPVRSSSPNSSPTSRLRRSNSRPRCRWRISPNFFRIHGLPSGAIAP
jgi:triosephosphate isomerase (TIM)